MKAQNQIANNQQSSTETPQVRDLWEGFGEFETLTLDPIVEEVRVDLESESAQERINRLAAQTGGE